MIFPGLSIFAKDAKGVIQGMGAKGRGDPGLPGEAYTASGKGRAELVHFTPNAMTVHVDDATPGDLLVLNQNWDPGWRARRRRRPSPSTTRSRRSSGPRTRRSSSGTARTTGGSRWSSSSSRWRASSSPTCAGGVPAGARPGRGPSPREDDHPRRQRRCPPDPPRGVRATHLHRPAVQHRAGRRSATASACTATDGAGDRGGFGGRRYDASKVGERLLRRRLRRLRGVPRAPHRAALRCLDARRLALRRTSTTARCTTSRSRSTACSAAIGS